MMLHRRTDYLPMRIDSLPRVSDTCAGKRSVGKYELTDNRKREGAKARKQKVQREKKRKGAKARKQKSAVKGIPRASGFRFPTSGKHPLQKRRF